MKYDFTSIMNRHGKDALAVDALGSGWAPNTPEAGFDAIPMWVADMNFPVPPSITEAIIERASHPAFGYYEASDDYYNAIINWHNRRNGVSGLTKENIGYDNGVLGGVISALNTVCSRGDKVLLHSPTYIGFTHALEDNGYKIVHSPLVQDENGIWRMDYADMEKKLKEEQIHAAIMCNPHNPCGRVWTKDELTAAMDLFKKYDVYVVSDEIWSDLILEGHKHTPTQSVSEDAKMRTVAMYAPSKTFNLAGLIGSYHIVYNTWWRDRINKESTLCHYNSMNVLSMHALIGAYSDTGEEWLEELRTVLTGNVDYAVNYIKNNLPGITCSRPEGTYMLFLDCTEYCETHNITIRELEEAFWRVGVAVQDGVAFHGPCHIRMNLAVPLSRVKEAFERISKYVVMGD
ncbi:MAG: aminotransferase class I/II-fold pyridoxal phosphate-dependent enzyme [Lachnospiraceae bacterium]|nr:aminotransferase class I/II-fold pyridoxal phosphate-dependent enzyme [Lachnospiraceae bacterium]